MFGLSSLSRTEIEKKRKMLSSTRSFVFDLALRQAYTRDFVLFRVPSHWIVKVGVQFRGCDKSVHRAGHVFESRSCMGRISLIAH